MTAELSRTARVSADAALMARIAAGDADASRELVARHAGPTARYAARILNDAAEGEDVAHDVILRLWRRADAWEATGSIGGWLKSAAYRAAIDRLRRSGRLTADPDGSLAEESAADDVDQESAVFGAEIGAAVESAMAGLPERQRAALTLWSQEGLSGAEIAEALDVSAEAVESLLARARRACRAALAGIYSDAVGGRADRRRKGA